MGRVQVNVKQWQVHDASNMQAAHASPTRQNAKQILGRSAQWEEEASKHSLQLKLGDANKTGV